MDLSYSNDTYPSTWKFKMKGVFESEKNKYFVENYDKTFSLKDEAHKKIFGDIKISKKDMLYVKSCYIEGIDGFIILFEKLNEKRKENPI